MEPSVKAINAEYETEVHFQKCYGVISEIFEAHDHLQALIPAAGFKFLDLGCAPGGFSSFLLDDPRCLAGFGVTLPSNCGGFPVRVRDSRFFLQQGDLFEIGPTDLIASEINIVVCDAQYLRNNISWDDKYRGVRCRSKQHGVWALLIKQFWLGLSRLQAGGVLIFRFGWRDPGPDDPATIWYKKMTLRLFSVLIDLFGQVKEVKSDYYNALQSSFYVCCSNFNKSKFDERQVAKLLGINFNYLISTRIEDSNELDILAQADKIRTNEVDIRISDMLDRIEKLRLINEGSRRWHAKKEEEREDPRAAVVLPTVPRGMSDEDLAASMSVYGRVLRVDRGNDREREVTVQFAVLEHANIAFAALQNSGAFGEEIRQGVQAKPVPRVAVADGASGPNSTAAAANGVQPTQLHSSVRNSADNAVARQVPKGIGTPSGAAAAGTVTDSGQSANDSTQKARATPPGFAPADRGTSCSSSKTAGSTTSAGSTNSVGRQRSGAGTAATAPTKRATGGPQQKASEARRQPVPQKMNLHPVLQDHQAKTRELIAELLKSK